jgi:hypothetical protein
MAGKTISMHASEEAARRLDHICRMEARSPSQVASAALDFYLRLPPEAHTALRHLHALGSEDERAETFRGLSRMLFNAQYEIAVRQMGEELRARGDQGPQAEEEMLAEGVRLTAREKPPTPRSTSKRSRSRTPKIS